MTDQERMPDAPGTSEASTGTAAGAQPAAGAPRHPFRPVLLLTVLLVLGVLATAGLKSYRDLETAKSYEQQLLDEIVDVNERIQALDRRIERIQHDPAMLERLAREDLGLVKADDLVIILPDELPERLDSETVSVTTAEALESRAQASASSLTTTSP